MCGFLNIICVRVYFFPHFFLNYTNTISKKVTYSGTLVSFFGCGAIKKEKEAELCQHTKV